MDFSFTSQTLATNSITSHVSAVTPTVPAIEIKKEDVAVAMQNVARQNVAIQKPKDFTSVKRLNSIARKKLSVVV